MENLLIHKNKKTKAYEIRKETHQGKEYMVVPVTMMVEGVHSGSMGAIFHSIEELGKFAAAWDGIPAVINHPTNAKGKYISANSPTVIDNVAVGRIYNTYVDNKALKAEAWLDPEKLKEVSEEAYNAISNNEMLEVSVGVFTENENTKGTYNGEKYNAIAYNHRPDHLALLPGGVGACSIEDGCGIRVNQKKGGNDVDLKQAIQAVNQQGFTVQSLLVFSSSFNEISEAIRQMLYKMETKDSYCYLEDVFEDKYIYCVSEKSGRKMYSQKYMYDDGKITTVGDATEVTKKVDIEYVPVVPAVVTFKRTKFENNSKKEENTMVNENCGGCMEKIVTIINSKKTRFTEKDRQWLLTQEESVLDMLLPVDEAPAVNSQTAPVAEKSQAPAVQALSAEDQSILAYGRAQMAKEREKFIQGIQANTQNIWTPTELAAMSLEGLEKLYKSVYKAPVQEETPVYLGAGSTTKIVNNGANDEFMPPLGVEIS